MLLGRIEAPHFTAGFEIDGDKRVFAPIISYMKDRPLGKIISYGCGNGWNVSVTNPEGIYGTPC